MGCVSSRRLQRRRFSKRLQNKTAATYAPRYRGRVQSFGRFGSDFYDLALADSDVDVVAILRVGIGKMEVYRIMQDHMRASPEFTRVPTGQLLWGDTIQMKFRGHWVDLKLVQGAESYDRAICSSACMQVIVKDRPAYVREAVLLFKLFLHFNKLTHIHMQRRGTKPKNIAACVWAYALLDQQTRPDIPDHMLAAFHFMALVERAKAFDWCTLCIHVPIDGTTKILERAEVKSPMVHAEVAVAMDAQAYGQDAGLLTGNCSRDAMHKITTKLQDIQFDEGADWPTGQAFHALRDALAGQDIPGMRQKLEQLLQPAAIAEAPAVAVSATAAPELPDAAEPPDGDLSAHLPPRCLSRL